MQVFALLSPSLIVRPAASQQHALHASHASRTPQLRMGFFDSLAAAFDNDDSLGDADTPGIKQKRQAYTITWKGPKGEETTTNAYAGQKIKDLARGAGVGPIKYGCSEGTCSSCDLLINGDRVPACQAKAVRKPQQPASQCPAAGVVSCSCHAVRSRLGMWR